MNDWAAFCLGCNSVRREDVEKCHVCGRQLRIICLGCGAARELGDHECKTVTIPMHPLALENAHLRAELLEYRQYVGRLGCERPIRHCTPLDDKAFEPCGECLPCRSHESVKR